jgi:hypothetical protein
MPEPATNSRVPEVELRESTVDCEEGGGEANGIAARIPSA